MFQPNTLDECFRMNTAYLARLSSSDASLTIVSMFPCVYPGKFLVRTFPFYFQICLESNSVLFHFSLTVVLNIPLHVLAFHFFKVMIS